MNDIRALEDVLVALDGVTTKLVAVQRKQEELETSAAEVSKQLLEHLGRFPEPADITPTPALEAAAAAIEGVDPDQVTENSKQVMLTLEFVQWVNQYLIPTFALESELHRWVEDVGVVSELRAAYIGYGRVLAAVDATFDPMDWHSRMASCIDRIRELRNRRVRQVRATNL